MIDPIEITSLDDPRVNIYRDVRDADLRGRDRLFMAESELVVRRLLRTPERLHSLFLSPNKHERLRDAIDAARATGAAFPIYLADVALMSDIAGFLIHRGALAAGFRKRAEELKMEAALGHLREQPELTLVLAEGVTNVDNMGALFRNAAAFGVDGIILDSTCCDPLYRKAIRVSVGFALSVPYAISGDWYADLETLTRRWRLNLIGAESDLPGPDRAVPLWDMPRAHRQGIVFGSEARGLEPKTRASCDLLVEIPMFGMPGGKVSSLNVATAAAIFLYERRVGAART